MPIDVKCSGCGAEFTTNDQYAGQKTRCPDCGHDIVIPRPAGAQPAPAPPAATPAIPPTVPAPPVTPPAPAAEAADAPARAARGRMVEYFRIALAIAVTLAMVKIIEAGVSVARHRGRVTPQSLADYAARSAQTASRVAGVLPPLEPISRRSCTIATAPALPVLLLLGAMGLLAVRLLLRTRMLDSLYVASPRWQERSRAGVTFYFLTTLGLIVLLAWTASVVKGQAASDGVVGALLAVWLIASCLVSLVEHWNSGREFPHVTGRMLNDLVFAAAVLAVFVYGRQIPSPVSRISAVSLLIFLNFAFDMTLSARFLLDSPATGGLARRAGFMLLSVVFIGGLGWFLAIMGL